MSTINTSVMALQMHINAIQLQLKTYSEQQKKDCEIPKDVENEYSNPHETVDIQNSNRYIATETLLKQQAERVTNIYNKLFPIPSVDSAIDTYDDSNDVLNNISLLPDTEREDLDVEEEFEIFEDTPNEPAQKSSEDSWQSSEKPEIIELLEITKVSWDDIKSRLSISIKDQVDTIYSQVTELKAKIDSVYKRLIQKHNIANSTITKNDSTGVITLYAPLLKELEIKNKLIKTLINSDSVIDDDEDSSVNQFPNLIRESYDLFLAIHQGKYGKSLKKLLEEASPSLLNETALLSLLMIHLAKQKKDITKSAECFSKVKIAHAKFFYFSLSQLTHKQINALLTGDIDSLLSDTQDSNSIWQRRLIKHMNKLKQQINDIVSKAWFQQHIFTDITTCAGLYAQPQDWQLHTIAKACITLEKDDTAYFLASFVKDDIERTRTYFDITKKAIKVNSTRPLMHIQTLKENEKERRTYYGCIHIVTSALVSEGKISSVKKALALVKKHLQEMEYPLLKRGIVYALWKLPFTPKLQQYAIDSILDKEIKHRKQALVKCIELHLEHNTLNTTTIKNLQNLIYSLPTELQTLGTIKLCSIAYTKGDLTKRTISNSLTRIIEKLSHTNIKYLSKEIVAQIFESNEVYFSQIPEKIRNIIDYTTNKYLKLQLTKEAAYKTAPDNYEFAHSLIKKYQGTNTYKNLKGMIFRYKPTEKDLDYISEDELDEYFSLNDLVWLN